VLKRANYFSFTLKYILFRIVFIEERIMANEFYKYKSWYIALLFWSICLFGTGFSMIEPPMEIRDMSSIAYSDSMGTNEKILRISKYLDNERYWKDAFYYLLNVDTSYTMELALNMFRQNEYPNEKKYFAGEFLVTRCNADEFIPEFAGFIKKTMLEIGEKEFCRIREELMPSAVGIYASVASGFWGYSSEYFRYFKDKRAIPILIKCLDAPDNVYGEPHWSEELRKVPGTSTGWNRQRQQIPVALARMNARESVDKLIDVLMNHHDGRLRYNAAYAIGYLSDERQSKRAEDYLLTLDNNWSYLFTFGKGLIENVDFNGIKYLMLEFDPLMERKTSFLLVISDIGARIEIIKGKRNKNIKILIKEIMNYKPFINILLFNYRDIKVRNFEFYDKDTGKIREFKTVREVVDYKQDDVVSLYSDIIACIKYNNLDDFDKIVRELARNSANREIRKISNRYYLDDFDY